MTHSNESGLPLKMTSEMWLGALADAWDAGYTSGHSNAMRRMSDEPNAPTTPNPYRVTPPGAES